jgi:hypothetical protein
MSMTDTNFFTDFAEDNGFDDRLLQLGTSDTETGYLQNDLALEYFKKKQSNWNRILKGVAGASALGLLGMPSVALFGWLGTALSIELSIPIDRIVKVMEILLNEFETEGITVIPRVKGDDGTIDLFVRTADRRYFALMLRSNGDSRIKWRKDRQQFFTIGKGKNSTWGNLELLGDKLNRIVLNLKKEKNPIVGLTNAERNKAFTKVIVLTGKTRLDQNNDPELLVPFGRTTALRITTKSTFYVVNLADLANFLRMPI